MPLSKSAKKALRVSRAKTLVNRRRKESLKTVLKTASADSLSKAFSLIDKSAKWGIIEKNRANRMKSRLSAQYAGSEPSKPKAEAKAVKAKPKAAAAAKTKKKV